MTRSAWIEEWDDSEAYLEAADLEAGLVEVLGHEADEITPESVDGWLAETLARLTPVESESFGKALGTLGSFAKSPQFRQFAGTALPAVGTAVGAIYGGPVGGALGNKLGTAAGSAFAGTGGSRAPRSPARPQPAVRRASAAEPSMAQPATGDLGMAEPVVDDGGGAEPAPAAAANGHDGSQAAAQLLYLIQNPTVLEGLLSLALGSHGRTTVPGPDGKEISRGALVGLLKNLAERAAEEADAFESGDGESTPSYLLDGAGRFLCDPANPEERADLLLRLLERQDEALSAEDVYESR